jgi:hypothetical protein
VDAHLGVAVTATSSKTFTDLLNAVALHGVLHNAECEDNQLEITETQNAATTFNIF